MGIIIYDNIYYKYYKTLNRLKLNLDCLNLDLNLAQTQTKYHRKP